MKLSDLINYIKERSGSDNESLIKVLSNAFYMSLSEVAYIPAVMTVNTDTTTEYYDLMSNLVAIRLVKIKNTDGTYTPLELIIEDDIDGKTGKPTYYYRSGSKIQFYPQADAVYEIKIPYYKTPTELANNTDEVSTDIPTRFQFAIVEGATDYLKANDEPDVEELSLANFHSARFESAKEALRQFKQKQDTTLRQTKNLYRW